MRMKTRRYDQVFSIGEACFCATSLASNGLRQSSDPFDWCIGGSFETRVELLASGFLNFINKKDLVKIGVREHPEPCVVYSNTRNNIVFNHDFPIDKTLDEAYDVVYQKYQRRIQRLLKNISESKRILCVYMELPKTIDGAFSNEEIMQASGQVNYDLITNCIICASTYIAKRGAKYPNSVSKKNLSKVLSFVYRKGKYRTLLKRKLYRLPNRSGLQYVTILGIKIKFRGRKSILNRFFNRQHRL